MDGYGWGFVVVSQLWVVKRGVSVTVFGLFRASLLVQG